MAKNYLNGLHLALSAGVPQGLLNIQLNDLRKKSEHLCMLVKAAAGVPAGDGARKGTSIMIFNCSLDARPVDIHMNVLRMRGG